MVTRFTVMLDNIDFYISSIQMSFGEGFPSVKASSTPYSGIHPWLFRSRKLEQVHEWGPLGSNGEFYFPFLFSDQGRGPSLPPSSPLEFGCSFLFSPHQLSAPYLYFRIFTPLMCLVPSLCPSWGDILFRTLLVL